MKFARLETAALRDVTDEYYYGCSCQSGLSTINDATQLFGPYNSEATNGFVGKTESKAVFLVFDAQGRYLSKSSASLSACAVSFYSSYGLWSRKVW
jgi:hypothetical protein